MAISKIVPQSTGFGTANVGLQIPNISLENRAAEASNGSIIFNTSNNAIEVYANGAWTGVGTKVSPTITSITGTLDSGNVGTKITVTGAAFDVDNVLSPGVLRFTYNGTTEEVAVTPNTSTSIENVTVPTNTILNAPNTTGTLQFQRSDGLFSNSLQKNFSSNVAIQYLVIGGGGGGVGSGSCCVGAGGGGAGGYRSSVVGETSGRGAAAESAFIAVPSTTYSVTIGAGGSSASGSNTTFATITSIGGGRGGYYSGSGVSALPGGSGGGSAGVGWGSPGTGTTAQGYDGGAPGTAAGPSLQEYGAGGGGAGANGNVNGDSTQPGVGQGGNGVASSITGTPVTRAGGGGASVRTNAPGLTGASGGSGGGGKGADSPGSGQTNGTVNTGSGGGGGSGGNSGVGSSGGSGVVILKYPNTISISNPGGGLTMSTAAGSPGYNVTTITAGTGNISWS